MPDQTPPPAAPPDLAALESAVAETLDQAKRAGATAAEASISTSSGLAVTVRMGEVETVEHTQDRGLGVTVYFGQRKASASTTDFAPDAIRTTVEAACSIARYTSEDVYAGLAEPDRMATDIPALDLYHPWALPAGDAIALALETENAARAVDPRITNSEGASVNRFEGGHVYGNSHGFVGGYTSTRHSVSCAVIAENDSGMQRDYHYTVSRRHEDLDAPEAVGRLAAERALGRLDAKQLGTRTVPVVYRADLAGGLFRHFVAAVSGGNLYRKSSFLLDKAGEAVFPDFVRIHEQPHLPRALGSAPFDDEGVATAPRDLVTGGVLEGYVLASYSARKLGLESTGNAGGVHNLTVEPGPGDLDLDGILRAAGSGLLVTELMGMGVNITTGDYSRGAAGFWFEDGEIRQPVEEITIAGNLAGMYASIREIGRDVDRRGNIRSGSVLVDGMTVAGS